MGHRTRGRGPGKRLTADQIAVARALNIRDFAGLYGVSPAIVRGWVTAGLPTLRFGNKFSILRVEGSAWVESRFRSDRVAKVVDSVLADLTRRTAS
jgi:hypothetical protein